MMSVDIELSFVREDPWIQFKYLLSYYFLKKLTRNILPSAPPLQHKNLLGFPPSDTESALSQIVKKQN